MKKALLSLLLVGATAATFSDAAYAATQTQMEFNYATSDTVGWGNNKMELFDVAVYVPGSTMQGKKITSIKVPMRASVAQNVSIWLSSELKLHNVNGLRTADPDIMQVSVENQPMITLTLDEPYEVPAEGVYVGYSFNIKSGSISSSDRNNPGRYPVTVSEGATDGGMYIHTTRTYTTWKSNTEANLDYNAYVGVELDGEFYNYAVGVAGLTNAKGGLDDPFVTVASLSNYGTESLSSFEYVLTTNGSSETNTYTFEQPVAPSFTSTFDVEFALPNYETPGTYDVELKVTKVNGQANEAPNNEAKTWADVFSFIPKHLALMEEYTGLWCGWCPRGYIGLLEMNKRHEDFVALSYHNGDDMAVLSSQYPSNVGGFPAAYIDRVISCDAYYGTYNYDMGVDQTWMERCEVEAPCDVDVMATWNSDSTEVTVKVTTRFQATYKDANYRIAYFLVGNGLKKSSWAQSNYYKGNAAMPSEYGWDVFTNGASSVTGLVFDDVALWSNNTKGEPGSIPAEITADEYLEFEGKIVLADVKSYNTLVAQQDISLFTVVAAVVDAKNNEVVNANKCHILTQGQDAIENIADSKATVVSTVYYDLNGRVAANPAPGIFIKAEKLSDGSSRTSKVVIY